MPFSYVRSSFPSALSAVAIGGIIASGTAAAYPPNKGHGEALDDFLLRPGTGSVYSPEHVVGWQSYGLVDFLKGRFGVPVVETGDKAAAAVDLRSPAEHVANIRNVLIPSISEFSSVLGVSRQAVYKWLSEDAVPENEKLDRIRVLSSLADELGRSGVARPDLLIKMKAFEGKSLLDIVRDGLDPRSYALALIKEGEAMEAARHLAGLDKSKAAPTDDWRSSISIPGALES